MSNTYDAVIVGSGPNGLSAAIKLAQEGLSVLVLEGKDTYGGGTRSIELTLPGFLHDICSAIHPLGLASPFLRELPLKDYGLSWIHPDAPLAHPLDDGRAVVIERSIEDTAEGLGVDGRAYRSLMEPLVQNWHGLLDDILGPFPFPPSHPTLLARFGLSAVRSASGLAKSRFELERTRTVFGGMCAHSMLPLESPTSAAFGLTLGVLAHGVGWPIAAGGSRKIADAMVGYLKSLGGDLQTDQMVTSLSDLPPAEHVLFDLTPMQILAVVGDDLQPGYRRRLAGYRYGPGVCKVDWALDEAIPWKSAEVKRAATVHIGGSLNEIAASEGAVWRGELSELPYVLLAQQTIFDASRAPSGKHTAWAYSHVPHGCSQDVSSGIEDQIERFAPGFKDCILARSVYTAGEMESYNPNYVGGDINGGVQDYRQLFTRPVARLDPYTLPTQTSSSQKNLYLCSSATPPGGGVHGMCGYYAARSVLRRT